MDSILLISLFTTTCDVLMSGLQSANLLSNKYDYDYDTDRFTVYLSPV